MPNYQINEQKQYAQSADAVFQAALGAIDGLQGKASRQDEAAGKIKAAFPKTIHGKVLGDRTEMLVTVSAESDNATVVTLKAYPINPVGQELLFGARKGVTRTVVNWFFAHLEHRLG